MASVVIVENDLIDSVKEYGHIVDALNQTSDFSAALKAHFDANHDSISDKQALAQTIINSASSATLSKLSDREFEPAFNLVLYVVSQLQNVPYDDLLAKDSVLLRHLVDATPTEPVSVRDRKLLRPTSILSVLNTAFNFVAESSPSRVHILELILEVVEKGHIDFALIQGPLGDHLAEWLRNAGASDAAITELFWRFVSLDSRFSYKTLQLIKAFTAQYAVELPELRRLVNFALSSEIVDVSFLVNNNVAAALSLHANDDLVQVFAQYTSGHLVQSVPASLPVELVQAKSRILALARFFADHSSSKNVFKYADVPSQLVSLPQDFEQLLVTAIKAGVIEGKLNQVDEVFALTRVNRFVVAGNADALTQNWENVKQVLIDWRIALDNISDVVNSTREDIVKGNSN